MIAMSLHAAIFKRSDLPSSSAATFHLQAKRTSSAAIFNLQAQRTSIFKRSDLPSSSAANFHLQAKRSSIFKRSELQAQRSKKKTPSGVFFFSFIHKSLDTALRCFLKLFLDQFDGDDLAVSGQHLIEFHHVLFHHLLHGLALQHFWFRQ